RCRLSVRRWPSRSGPRTRRPACCPPAGRPAGSGPREGGASSFGSPWYSTPVPHSRQPGGRSVRGYSMHKDDYRNRLRRIEGQVRGLQRMVDEDEYCVDILTQIVSVTKALQGVGLGLLDEHLRSCVRDAAESSRAEGDAKLTEAVQAVERLLKV